MAGARQLVTDDLEPRCLMPRHSLEVRSLIERSHQSRGALCGGAVLWVGGALIKLKSLLNNSRPHPAQIQNL